MIGAKQTDNGKQQREAGKNKTADNQPGSKAAPLNLVA